MHKYIFRINNIIDLSLPELIAHPYSCKISVINSEKLHMIINVSI